MHVVISTDPSFFCELEWVEPPLAKDGRFKKNESLWYGKKAEELLFMKRLGLPVARTWVIPSTLFDESQKQMSPECTPLKLIQASKTNGFEDIVERAKEEIRNLQFTDFSSRVVDFFEQHNVQFTSGFELTPSLVFQDANAIKSAAVFDLPSVESDSSSMASLFNSLTRVWGATYQRDWFYALRQNRIRSFKLCFLIQPKFLWSLKGVLQTGQSCGAGTRSAYLEWRGESRIFRVTPKQGGVWVTDAPAVKKMPLEASEILEDIVCRLEKESASAWDVDFLWSESIRTLQVKRARLVSDREKPNFLQSSNIWTSAFLGDHFPSRTSPLMWSLLERFHADLAGENSPIQRFGVSSLKLSPLFADVDGYLYVNATALIKPLANKWWLDADYIVRYLCSSNESLFSPPEFTQKALSETEKEQKALISFEVQKLEPYLVWPKIQRALRHFIAAFYGENSVLEENREIEKQLSSFEPFARAEKKRFLATDLAVLPNLALAKTWEQGIEFLQKTETLLLRSSLCVVRAELEKMYFTTFFKIHDPMMDETLHPFMSQKKKKVRKQLEAVFALFFSEMKSLPDLNHVGSIKNWPDGRSKMAFFSFLREYGDCGQKGLDISEKRLKEDPNTLFLCWKNYVTSMPTCELGEERTFPTNSSSDRRKNKPHLWLNRTEIESFLRSAAHPISSLGTRLFFNQISERTDFSQSLQEQSFYWLNVAYSRLRDIALEANTRLVRLAFGGKNPGGENDSLFLPIFFLNSSELISFLRDDKHDWSSTFKHRRDIFLSKFMRPRPPLYFVGAPPRISF